MAEDATRWWTHQPTIPEHRDAASVQESNRIILRAVLATACGNPRPRRACLMRFLTAALRYNGAPVDERNRWQRIQYRTEGCLTSEGKPTEEHVVTNQWFCQVLLGDPGRWLDDAELVKLLALQARCLITEDEHRSLGPGFAWRRYLVPQRTIVHDCRARSFKVVDVDELATALEERVRALGLTPA